MLRVITQRCRCLGLIVIAASCSTGSETSMNYQGTGFSVVLPPNLSVIRSSPVEDFEIYQFTEQGEKLLEVYVGNFPAFRESVPTNVPIRTTMINSLEALTASWQDQQGRRTYECLIRLEKDGIWPSCLHVTYSGLSEERASLANGIISSLKRRSGKRLPN